MPDTLVSIAVTLPATTLQIGGTTQAVARVTVDVTDGSVDQRPLTWSSSSPSVATVDTNGLVRGVAAGTAQIRATNGTVTGAATVTVAVPVVAITSAQETAIAAVPIGGRFTLQGPTRNFDVVVNA